MITLTNLYKKIDLKIYFLLLYNGAISEMQALPPEGEILDFVGGMAKSGVIKWFEQSIFFLPLCLLLISFVMLN